MKRSRKSNRVSWAPGFGLYQVKLFLSEDCPSKVGQKFQDHLQAKKSWMLQSNTVDSHDIPPGFEWKNFQNTLKEEVSRIPLIKWRCPARLILSCNWHVAAGEESEERDVQKLREMRVLEAVYPRQSSIPQTPSVSVEVADNHHDDSDVPIIPVIPIEEEECMDVNSDIEGKVTSSVIGQPEFFPHDKSATATRIGSTTSNAVSSGESGASDFNADVVAAASAALAAIMKCNELGSTIDTDLLIRILTDQKMSEKLINERARAATAPCTVGEPNESLKPSVQSVPLSGATVGAHYTISQSPTVIPSSTTAMDMNRPVNQSTVTIGVPTSNQKPCSVVPPSAPIPDVSRPMNQNAGSLSTSNSKPATPAVPHSTGRPDLNGHMIQNIYHLPQSGVLNSQPVASGVKRVASVAFPASCVEPTPVLPPIGNGNFQVRLGMNPMPNPPKTGSIPSAMSGSCPVKDANYYKNLIREHGMDKLEIMKPQVGSAQSNIHDLKMVPRINAGEVKPRYQKPCMYFNSPKGCRNGSNCHYLHETGVHLPTGSSVGAEGAKRMRL